MGCEKNPKNLWGVFFFILLCSYILKIIKKIGGKIYPQGAIRRDRRSLPLFFSHYGNRTAPVRKDDAAPQLVLTPAVLLVGKISMFEVSPKTTRSLFLNQHTEGMILDEVHNAPNLLSYIQGMVDK